MTKTKHTITALTLAVVASSAIAAPAVADETLRYDWRLRGALSWVARVRFPTSGTGVLQTSERAAGTHSQLRVSAGGRDYLEYQSLMDESARRTLRSVNGYSFGSKSEHKETVYDYAANLARLAEQEDGEVSSKTRPLAVEEARDVLTTIAYLREHATAIRKPVTTLVFSEGKPYRVTITPQAVTRLAWKGEQVPARPFRVASAPGEKKKFSGLTVWISDDAQRLPLRIVIEQQYASLDLRLRAS